MSNQPRGRPPKTTKQICIRVERKVLDELNLYLLDPETGKMKYGALSTLTNNLLAQLLERLRKPDVQPKEFLKAFGVELDSNSTQGNDA